MKQGESTPPSPNADGTTQKKLGHPYLEWPFLTPTDHVYQEKCTPIQISSLVFACCAMIGFVASGTTASSQVVHATQVPAQLPMNQDSIRLDRDCEQRDEREQCTMYGPSLITLIARPELYDGKPVRVVGFVRFEFEGNALYLSRLDYENSVTRNGLWIDPPPGSRSFGGPSNAMPNSQYVLVEAIFNARHRGHMGLWSGALEHVTRLDGLPFPKPIQLPTINLVKPKVKKSKSRE